MARGIQERKAARNGFGLRELSALSGLSIGTISKMERGIYESKMRKTSTKKYEAALKLVAKLNRAARINNRS